MSLFTAVVLATMFATVVALATGISSMVADRQVAHADSVHWMIRRVEFQAVAILALLFAVYLSG